MKKTLHFEKSKMEGKWFKPLKKPTFDSLIRPDMCSIWKKEETDLEKQVQIKVQMTVSTEK